MKIESLTLLLLLTFTVIAYNYQFHSIPPSSMYLNAYKLSELEIPAEYVDVTNDSGFRVWVIDYVIACDIIRTGMTIEEYDLPYVWLKHASNSSKGYDMTIKFFDDFYYLQVRYYPYQRTSLEHGILWTINIVTVIAWVLFTIKSLRNPPQKMKGENKE